MKGPATVKSAIVWGVSLLVALALVTFVNWFIYPLTSANPDFNDVESVFNSIQVPSDWTVVEESENRGIAGRQCPIESESMCFHKSKTYKVESTLNKEAALNLIKSSSCPSPLETNNSQIGSNKESFTYSCMNGLIKLFSAWDKNTDGSLSISLTARSR